MERGYFEMRRRKDGEVVRVYEVKDGMALIFSASQYQRDGGGWQKIKMTQMIPIEFPVNKNEYVSKTMRNKAKERMKLVDATWETTDGKQWAHKDIDAAIEHELEIMNYLMTSE